MAKHLENYHVARSAPSKRNARTLNDGGVWAGINHLQQIYPTALLFPQTGCASAPIPIHL